MKIKCHQYKDGMQFKYAHLKRDGIWLEIIAGHLVKALTSQETDISSQLRHCQWFANVLARVPPGEILVGELWVPGQPASYVKSALAKSEPLSFDCFAISTMGYDIPLERVESQCNLWGIPFTPYLRHVSREPYGGEWVVNTTYESFVKDHGKDCEGVVFKDGNRLNWHKWKPVRTVDCIITGIIDGRGKNLGLVGSLQVSLADGRVIANAGGMDDTTRILMSEDEDSLIGRVVEVAYQYVGSGGKLRHPRFIRFRDDKQPHECTSDQDEDLDANN